jgi:hypothetical protein
LGDAQALGGLAVVQLLGDRHEVAKVSQLHTAALIGKSDERRKNKVIPAGAVR